MQIKHLKDIGIITDKLAATRDFYVQHLGFQLAFVAEWYVHLKNGPVELGVMAGKPEMPAAPGNGVWISLEVENVDAEYTRLLAAGATLDSEPKDQPWGERAFIVRDPNGLGINLSTTIPVDDEFMWSNNLLVNAAS